MAVQARNKKAPKQDRATKAGLVKPSLKTTTPDIKPGLAVRLRHRMQLNQTLFARLLPVSVRTLATLESGKPPTEVVARRLNELLRLTNALSEVIQKESLGAWLKVPNPAFNGLKPLEVIDRGETDRIWSMIFYLRSGVPS